MSWHVNILMLGFTALAEPVSDTGSDDIVLYEASRRMEVYRRRSSDSPLRGVVSRGDIFEVPLTLFDGVDAVYDRASLVALPIELRKKYVDFILKNLKKCKILLQTLAFDNKEVGPPFSIEEDDVKNYFKKQFSIECISKVELDAEGMHGGKITKLYNLAFQME